MGTRVSGVLLHPTALPGRHGVGDLGEAARRWLDWLAEAGQGLWQVLPLGPAGLAGSPYDGPSSYAGDPLLIALDELADEGLLDPAALDPEPSFPASAVELASVRRWKGEQLRRAWQAPRDRGPGDRLAGEIDAWAAAPDFANAAHRLRNVDALHQQLAAWTAEFDDRELAARLQSHGVAAAPVLNVGDLLHDPHYRTRGTFIEVRHPLGFQETIYGAYVKTSRTEARVEPGPAMGRDNEYVFKELLGIPEERYRQLVEDQIIY